MSELMNDQENLDMYDSTDSNENSTVERCLTFESGDLILYISTALSYWTLILSRWEFLLIPYGRLLTLT